jgi:hypothetical protein
MRQAAKANLSKNDSACANAGLMNAECQALEGEDTFSEVR